MSSVISRKFSVKDGPSIAPPGRMFLLSDSYPYYKRGDGSMQEENSGLILKIFFSSFSDPSVNSSPQAALFVVYCLLEPAFTTDAAKETAATGWIMKGE
ncbi:MAG: hypothetical protein HFF67_09220 [Oscillospiraceae bacterium]|jgi:hypothetical protein|nr:hypothetical protein [Oscillospiraceae bacterium]MCI9318207.1 hypothetical protein [Oscillospiraceae bacterium]MDE6935642.1 hypothetical protein [Oscillospiraceae bacterium]